MYIIVRCPSCGNLQLANIDTKTKKCINCGHKSDLRTLRIYGRARTPHEASELLKHLKEVDGPGVGYKPTFKRIDSEK